MRYLKSDSFERDTDVRNSILCCHLLCFRDTDIFRRHPRNGGPICVAVGNVKFCIKFNAVSSAESGIWSNRDDSGATGNNADTTGADTTNGALRSEKSERLPAISNAAAGIRNPTARHSAATDHATATVFDCNVESTIRCKSPTDSVFIRAAGHNSRTGYINNTGAPCIYRSGLPAQFRKSDRDFGTGCFQPTPFGRFQ